MEITLPPDLTEQVRQELAEGCYRGTDDLIEQAVRHFLEDAQRSHQRRNSLRRLGDAVDQAGLFGRILIPDQQ